MTSKMGKPQILHGQCLKMNVHLNFNSEVFLIQKLILIQKCFLSAEKCFYVLVK